jgi:ribonuclease Z
MTTKVTITGTGVPHRAPGRAGPGVLVESGAVRLQFDAGQATSLRLIEAGVQTNQLTALFVTHHHSDHLTGLTDVLFSRWLESHGNFTPLPVIAPLGPSVDFLEKMMDPWQADIAIRASHVHRDDHPGPRIVAFDPAPTRSGAVEVWADEANRIRVLARSVHHEPVSPAVAYRIDTPDGAVVISGDTIVCDEVAELATGAQVLVHEAFRRERMLKLVGFAPQLEHIAAYHADTVELGRMAASIRIPTVVLTHLIPAPGSGLTSKEDFADDLQRGGYEGRIIVADDLTFVELRAAELTTDHPPGRNPPSRP